MRLSYEVENDRREIILESDDIDRSGDVNDWSVLFQWAADFEFGEGASEERDSEPQVTYKKDGHITAGVTSVDDTTPTQEQESFKAGQELERKAVIDI